MAAIDLGLVPTTRDDETDDGEAEGLGDLAELYRSHSRSLRRIVCAALHAPEPVIEEACQVAWARLVSHRNGVRRETALGWLVTTATREAVRLIRDGNRELSLDSGDTAAQLESLLIDPGPSELVERRDRLARLSRLPVRQQRLLWLRGLGLSYDEIALRDGCTTRTVERQLSRARSALRMAEAQV